MKSKILLSIILISGLILRLIQINQYPPSLNWDEVSLGYNAYSILKTAKDEWGVFLPSIFRAYGDYKLPLYSYLSIPFIALLGLNPLSVKIISLLSGTILIFLSYLIVHKLTSQKIISLVAAAIIAFSPWSIFLSRIALEANLYLTLFAATIYFLLSQKPALASFFLALSLFSYNSSRVIFPIFLLFIIFYQYKKKANFKFKKYLPLIFALILLGFQLFSQSGQARYKWVSLLDQGAINQINELRSQYPRFLVNKATFFAYQASKNYLSHFHPQFLFQKGGSHYQFNLQNYYLIHPILPPLLILGLFFLIKQAGQKNINFILILSLFLLAPLPSAITRDAPHTLRSISFIYLASIIIALALGLFKKQSLKYFFTLIIGLSLLLSQIQFWPKYKSYSSQYSSSWQSAYPKMVDYLKKNYDNYQQIFITKHYGEPHEFILFYWPWSPQKYQNDPSKLWQYHTDWYWVNAFDKFVFLNDWEIPQISQNLPPRSLLITSPGNYHPSTNPPIDSLTFTNGQKAFDIISYD